MITRRHFFGKAAIGAVGIAVVSVIPWENIWTQIAKLFTPKYPKWRYIQRISLVGRGMPVRWRIYNSTYTNDIKGISALLAEPNDLLKEIKWIEGPAFD